MHFTGSELNEFLLFVERIEEKFVSYLWKRCDTFADLVLHLVALVLFSKYLPRLYQISVLKEKTTLEHRGVQWKCAAQHESGCLPRAEGELIEIVWL